MYFNRYQWSWEMSNIKDEDQSLTGVNEAEPTERVGEQVQRETSTEMDVGRKRIYPPISSPEADSSCKRLTPPSRKSEEHFSTAQSGVQVPVERHTFQSESVGQVLKRQAPQNKGVVQVPQRQFPLLESLLKRQTTLSGLLKAQTTLSGRFDRLSHREASLEKSGKNYRVKGHLLQAGGSVQVPTVGRVLQEESGVQKPIEAQAARAESSYQGPIERQTSLPESLVEFLLEVDPLESSNLQGQVLQEESGRQEPIEGQASQVKNILKFLLKDAPLETSNLQGKVQVESGVPESIEGQASKAGSFIEFPYRGDPLEARNFQVPLPGRDFRMPPKEDLPEINAENMLRGTRGGRWKESLFPSKTSHPPYMSLTQKMQSNLPGQVLQVESGVPEPAEGQASKAGSLVKFLYRGDPLEVRNFQVPLPRRDFHMPPKEDLPEINVENILRGTGGQRNQSLFPSRTSYPPYMSLTQKMLLDEGKEIVDLTKERKKKKKRFRCKFEDESTEESSSSSEETKQPRSESSSTELQFPVDL